MGFLGLISAFLLFKSGILGIPRLLFLAFLAMICGPFYVALVRTPKLPFLIPPIVALFLMYPIAAPHGIVFSTDPIFNFAFTEDVVKSGFWAPGAGNGFARTYSFYPLGNVFIGYVILTANLPAAAASAWIEPILRLLAVPATVFSIGRRLFSTRIAVLGVFFYLGTASILFNVPVQQGMGIIFVGLSLLSLIMLTRSSDKSAQRRSQVLFMLVAVGIIMTHHLSSYIFAGWLGALAVLMSRPRFRPIVGTFRFGLLFGYFLLVLALYITFFTYSIFLGHELDLTTTLGRFVAPENFPPAGPTPGLGRTFTTEEIAWLAGSVLTLLLLALAALYRFRNSREHSFAVANGLVAATITIATLPLVATGFSFVTLRIGEYTNLFTGPFAAATLIRMAGASTGRWSRLMRGVVRNKDWLPRAAVCLIAAAILMGGNLAPASFRPYFEAPSARTTDTPLLFGQDDLRAAEWAAVHFRHHPRMWGDQLAIDAFAGFADMEVDYGGSQIFTSTTLDASLWCSPTAAECGSKIAIGDYITVDKWMHTLYRPNFYLQPALLGPLNETQVQKFVNNPHLAVVFNDEVFTIYRVISYPPP
jgi:hypothetical protein